jgi:hypothetical protein
MIETLRQALVVEQARIVGLLREGIGQPDWRPDAEAWTFRMVAAHMRHVEIEGWYRRTQLLLTIDRPTFHYYLNTGWRFDGLDMVESLTEWERWRQRWLDLVGTFSAEEQLRYGEHSTFGKLTVQGLMQVALDHDRGHAEDIERMVEKFRLRAAN